MSTRVPRLEALRSEASRILETAIEQYQPAAVFALFSGGHDSLTCTHMAAEILGERLTGVAHIDTGIGIPETQQFVKDVCGHYKWPLQIYRASENTYANGTPNPQVYEEIILEHGFPGGPAHQFMYTRLKGRQVERLVRDYRGKRGNKVMLITGVRREESTRRMGTVREVNVVSGGQVWVAPMINVTSQDQHDYMAACELPRSPVKEKLCMSGECLCGAFAHRGELAEIAYWYPDVADRIHRLEQAVLAKHGRTNGWEGRDDDFKYNRQGFLPLCVGCEQRAELASVVAP
ncbi:3'-phosphoadenosine 5'-phosphosulfate sulfotransferase (PAPS reductase)/FAD synthetase [Modicisalibacter muralis]|uniref:3'-phosphoadenosine 5'-phosphosulfate sulfotransferase (PAPS reductase)/FAD synthetase n=1 Tax=Modicisalibacter muralis TaxID=119000 RepID=A0A1G9MVQ8_9GAMM|nr:phosphoadenosine phosphosulfate reductase family protein [Halomonas muralis]SDL78376.1 3'-phosphoadenosine 5'-phosphosulfate sulfotransferase (PAPS reductase)/FAD synthetase [Halomonas muralis]